MGLRVLTAERTFYTQEVNGSSPLSPTTFIDTDLPMRQDWGLFISPLTAGLNATSSHGDLHEEYD